MTKHDAAATVAPIRHSRHTFWPRRTFLKAGLLGAIALAATGGIYRAMQGPSSPTKFILDDEAAFALRAITVALLNDAIPSASPDAIEKEIARVQNMIAGLPLDTQKEIQDVFSLLVLSPTRRLLVGISNNWKDANNEDVTAFLQRWRTHRFATPQIIYHALHDLVIGSWYADESAWATIGYPGPIKELS